MMDAVFESEVLLGDQDRAHDLLRSLLVTTTDPARLSVLWRVYGSFCLRSGDRLKAAELALQESLKYQHNSDALFLLFGVLASTQRVKQAVALLNETTQSLGLVLRYSVGNQKALLRSALLPDGDESDNEVSDSSILALLRALVVKYRLVDFFATVRAALPDGCARRCQKELSILEGRVQMAKKNWKTALNVLLPLRGGKCEADSDSQEVACLLAETFVKLHDVDNAIQLLSGNSSTAHSCSSPEELLDGGDMFTSPLLTRFRLGHLLFKRRRWADALTVFRDLAKLHPMATVHAAIAACCLNLGDFPACLEAAKQACALDPMRADAWGVTSYAMLHLGMWQSAEVCFNLYLDRLLPGPGAQFISSWLLIELGFAWASRRPGVIGGGKAEACALQALRISGASPKVHWLLGESMVASKMTDRGVMEMLTAVQAYSKTVPASGDETETKTQREQVLLRALSLASDSSQSLYDTVKAAVIKHAPHLLGKVVPAAVPKLALAGL